MSEIVIMCDGTWKDASNQDELSNTVKIRDVLFRKPVRKSLFIETYLAKTELRMHYNFKENSFPDYFICYDTDVGSLGHKLYRIYDGMIGAILKENLIRECIIYRLFILLGMKFICLVSVEVNIRLER